MCFVVTLNASPPNTKPSLRCRRNYHPNPLRHPNGWHSGFCVSKRYCFECCQAGKTACQHFRAGAIGSTPILYRSQLYDGRKGGDGSSPLPETRSPTVDSRREGRVSAVGKPVPDTYGNGRERPQCSGCTPPVFFLLGLGICKRYYFRIWTTSTISSHWWPA